jgi:hypothetical protein
MTNVKCPRPKEKPMSKCQAQAAHPDNASLQWHVTILECGGKRSATPLFECEPTTESRQ